LAGVSGFALMGAIAMPIGTANAQDAVLVDVGGVPASSLVTITGSTHLFVPGTAGIGGAATLNSATVTNGLTTNGITNTGTISTGTGANQVQLNGATGNISGATLNTTGLATLNSASVTTTLGVTGATTLNNSLTVDSNGTGVNNPGTGTLSVGAGVNSAASLQMVNDSFNLNGLAVTSSSTTLAGGQGVTGGAGQTTLVLSAGNALNGAATLTAGNNLGAGLIVNNSGTIAIDASGDRIVGLGNGTAATDALAVG